MSSLIANQVKTNLCFVSIKLFIVLTTFVPLFNLCHVYNNNYNNNYAFVILICFILHTTDMFKHATSHKAALQLPVVCFVLPFYSPTRSVKRRFLKQKILVLAFLRTLFRPSCLLLVVFLKNVRCICVHFASCYVRFHCVCFFILMVFIFVAFAYFFHVKDIRQITNICR